MFNIDQDIARHSRGQGQRFLRQALLQPVLADSAAHLMSNLLPMGCSRRIVLAGSGRHAPQLLRGRTKSLPH